MRTVHERTDGQAVAGRAPERRAVRGGGGDEGQVAPLAALMVGLSAVLLLAFVPVGQLLTARAQARTAADAAALAGAAEGEEAARRVAEANGGTLLELERRGSEVVVRVEVGGVDAYARARSVGPAEGERTVPAGGGDRAGLAPAMQAALARADALLGRPVPVMSGLRTRAEQEALWRRRSTNPYPVARPGTSDHERGLAIDVASAAVADLAAVAPAAGLCQPLPVTDPVHFVVCGR